MEEEIKEIVKEWGVSGYENPIRTLLYHKVKDMGKIRVDPVGNLWLTLGKGKKRVAFLAHLDELGLVVSRLTSQGTAKFKKVGGIDDRTLPGRHVELLTSKNRVLEGVIGLPPPHLMVDSLSEMNKVIPWQDMEVYFGVNSKKALTQLGVSVLDPLRVKKDFFSLPNEQIVCRGMDDRIGCYILLELARKTSKWNLNFQLDVVWTVQEEYGLRGARAVARNTFDEVYVLDTISSTQGCGASIPYTEIFLGQGPVIRFIDRAGISSPALMEKVKKVAKKAQIPLQCAVSGGTTDATAVFEGGSPAISIGIPIAYTHSAVEICSLKDVKNTLRLCGRLLETF